MVRGASSKVGSFAIIVNSFSSITTVVKPSIWDVCEGPSYFSDIYITSTLFSVLENENR